MIRINPLAFVLVGVAMLIMATPSSAAVRAKKTGHGTAIGSPSEARAQGSPRINREGMPFRTPPLCAYPLRYDGEGVPIFQTQGCRMP
jgi:hypothetical protein